MAKKRISVTLNEGVVEKVDSEAKQRELNRSQMMESIIEQYFKQKGLETAVILCGDEEAKSLEIHEGKPVLSHILDNLSEEGFSRVLLLIGQNTEIKESFGSEYKDMVLDFVKESEPSGTASALEKVEDKIERDFVVLNGHVIADVDIQDMLKVHEEEVSAATIALTAVEDTTGYGVAKLKGRKVLGFVEKPDNDEELSKLINAGTYIFGQEIFNYLDGKSLEQTFSTLAERSELSGYIYGGYWKDIDQ